MSNNIYGSTLTGGDYSEIYFWDKKYNIVEKNLATHVVIRECKMDGTLLKDTWFRYDADIR